MLRSAYEAVTNSRFGIFEKHENRLAYRLSTSIGLEMVPARIENDEICLYPGTSEVSNNGKPKSDQPMYAAWLERYERNGNNLSNFALKYSDRSLPKHREKVTAWVEKYQKITANRDGRTKIVFSYWKVRKIVPFGENIGGQPQPVNGHGAHQPTGEMKKIDGFVCITNKNIDNKHDERVFFATSTTPPIKVKLTSELREKWIDLISNYQSIHEDEINKQVNGPPALRHAKWSRQVTEGESEKRLNEGTLCYAHVKKIGDDYKVLNLYPVIIPRGLYEVAPNSCLDSTLEPASWIDKLSPADRVFGWVRQNENRQANQKGATSYKGNLRIFKVTCNSDNAIESFGTKGFPLAILGQPNEQQARFYQAEDKEGTPLLDQFSKEQMYSKKEQGLRGRKVYPHHHGLPDEHWQNPKIHRKEPNNGHYQEYRQPSGEDEKTDQNRSIQAWVKPAVKFSFTIDIINLSPVELGALLWLLSLEDNYYHRLGGAKPLGFGSVKLSINWETTDLRTGQGWKQYYSSLVPIQSPDSQEALSCIDLFKQAIEAAYGNGRKFEQVSFIKAFSVMAQGFEDKLPIHYPRITPEINPNGEGFDWFVANEKVGKQEGGLKLSLPSLAEDKGLPINPTT
jgi:CRISPR-associated protein (TIGR03986 family)